MKNVCLSPTTTRAAGERYLLGGTSGAPVLAMISPRSTEVLSRFHLETYGSGRCWTTLALSSQHRRIHRHERRARVRKSRLRRAERRGQGQSEHSLVIERPPAEVFSYATDPDKLLEWQSTALEARSDGSIQQGVHVTEVRKFLGRRMESEVEVTAYEPDRRFALEVVSGAHTVHV